jgi:2-polyprenyl-3-methyl-5-hydroxy-6-metoxy-1,4-benzoquinol methylase
MATCKVCGNVNGSSQLTAREMMYGEGGEFKYVECSRCGCLQIVEVPADLSRYYREGYYSFDAPAEEGRLKQFFIRKRARHLAGHKNPVGRLYALWLPAPPMPAWLKGVGVGFGDEILDVGCGAGGQLIQLSYLGFSHLTGVDPFIERSIRYRSGVVVLRRSLEEMDGAYDFIMLHHSLEHLPDQVVALEHLQRLLKPTGRVLLRTPLVGSRAWREYGADWAQLDAPRHLCLHTERSVQFLAERTGFRIERVVYDSTGFQFWGSEQIRRGVPLLDKDTGRFEPRAELFTDEELRAFEEEAMRLNEAGEGDQACFYLQKV